MTDTCEAAPARRALFRGFRSRPDLRASLLPHGHADGQHAVLQHDAEPAAAAYRSAFLRNRDRMGPAADEFAVHARPDDRHVGRVIISTGTTIANLGMTGDPLSASGIRE